MISQHAQKFSYSMDQAIMPDKGNMKFDMS